MNSLVSGFGLILFAALAGGAFAVPLKMRRRYEWENTWLLGFFFALIVIPLATVTVFLPVWWQAVANSGFKTLAIAVAFGFLWGWGAVTFAIGINAIGLSLGYAIIMGLSTAVGSIIPMARRWGVISGDAKAVILVGILACVGGVAVCGRAGMLRERTPEPDSASAKKLSAGQKTAAQLFMAGVLWCVLSGFLSACANLGFDFANRVAQEASNLGAGPLSASIGRWLPMYWGGFLAILIGTGSTLVKKGTWRKYVAPGTARDFVLAILLGLGNFLAQIPYGMGAHFLGELGTSVGWAINIALSLLVANMFGFVTGEWKTAPRSSIRMLYVGLLVLIIAMVILGYGNSLASHHHRPAVALRALSGSAG
jgi:L-rhamnose-proton symport protein (RhaT)